MKKMQRIARVWGLTAGVLLLAGVHSCVLDLDGGQRFDAPLSVQPSVSGSTPTKATVPDDSSQKENDLISLDVFIKGVTVPSFWKTYHLTVAEDQLEEAVDNLLARNWREEKDDSETRSFVEGDKYDVYAVANSDLTSGTVASFAALSALRESEYSPACLWDDGSVNPEALNLHKTYKADFDPSSASGQNRRAFTNSKKFVMDGFVKDWSPVGGAQVIPMTLERAASKFEVNVSFSDEFLQNLAKENKSITGMPGWRFVNFAYDAPLINPEHYGGTVSDAEHVLTAGALLLGNAAYGTPEENYKFTINTYSYPRKWALEDVVNEAPALVVSVGFADANGTQYTYYRIPLVDQKSATSIGRNMFYRVNAVIESSGSTSLDDLTGLVVDYQVIPWNDASHSGDQPSDVLPFERLYLQVTPHTYTLRGDGTQSVDLTYKVPTGKHVKIQYFASQQYNEAIAAGNTVGNVGNPYSSGNAAAFYYNKSGTYRTYFVNGNVQVSIVDNNSSGEIDKGTITVSSNSLANKAIKHIVFRVYLDVDGWFAKGLYRDIYIRHFPTDNIQGIAGSWSSRTSDVVESVPQIRFTSATGYTYESGRFYYSYAEYQANRQYIQRDVRSSYSNPASSVISDNEFATYYNSEENAALLYYSDGTPVYIWRESSWWAGTTYYLAQYYRDGRYVKYSDHHWVDWSSDANATYSEEAAKVTYDDNHFFAKVYNENDSKVYPIIVSRTGSVGNYSFRYSRGTSQTGTVNSYSPSGYTARGTNMTSLTNNYMYVIQIAETNPTYKLGRPELDENYQTNDHVVSPAFMIASQLGAVTTFGNTEEGGRSAAWHCNTYMEVAKDGTRYTGWRLPTEEEIRVIIQYQGTDPSSVTIDGVTITDNNDRVLTPVLTGSHYWTSNNKLSPVETHYDTGQEINYAVRCIRDMSPEEIHALNKD